MSHDAANDFLMGGGGFPASFFNRHSRPGDTVLGTIAETPRVVQQLDFQTKKPLVWPDGNPRNQLVIVLQTTLRDASNPDDTGKRTIWIKGKDTTAAMREAVQASGAKGLEIGGQVTAKFTHEVPIANSNNVGKAFSFTYRPPVVGVPGAAPEAQSAPPVQNDQAAAAKAALAALSPEQRAALGLA